MKDPHKRIGRRFVAWGAAGLLGLAVIAVLLPVSDDESDPTRFGPARYLRIQTCAVHPINDGHELRLQGVTNLVAKALLRVRVEAAGREIESYEATVDSGAFGVTVPSTGTLEAGDYDVRVSFRLEEQPRPVQEALHFQPRRLATSTTLRIEAVAGSGADLQGEFRALFDEANRLPANKDHLGELDRRALELSERLFIGKKKSALRKLRLALEVAGRTRFDRREFERLLLEAHVLAGL